MFTFNLSCNMSAWIPSTINRRFEWKQKTRVWVDSSRQFPRLEILLFCCRNRNREEEVITIYSFYEYWVWIHRLSRIYLSKSYNKYHNNYFQMVSIPWVQYGPVDENVIRIASHWLTKRNSTFSRTISCHRIHIDSPFSKNLEKYLHIRRFMW